MVPAITQERPQVRDNVLERRTAVLPALDLDEGFDVRCGQPRKTAIGRQSTGQKVGHGCPVLLERLLRKPAYLGKVVVIAATQQAQRVSPFNGNQASCGGQEAGEDAARAEILVGAWLKTGSHWTGLTRPGTDDDTLTFFQGARDGSMRWGGGDAASERPQGPGRSGVGADGDN